MTAVPIRPPIRLEVPATLAHRDLAVRVVSEACRLVVSDGPAAPEDRTRDYDLRRPFDAEFVSAFAEIFNNIVIHAYRGLTQGEMAIELHVSDATLRVDILDNGHPFDISAVPEPALDQLPEGGMGIHIARTMLDDVSYAAGPPNRWTLRKTLRPINARNP